MAMTPLRSIIGFDGIRTLKLSIVSRVPKANHRITRAACTLFTLFKFSFVNVSQSIKSIREISHLLNNIHSQFLSTVYGTPTLTHTNKHTSILYYRHGQSAALQLIFEALGPFSVMRKSNIDLLLIIILSKTVNKSIKRAKKILLRRSCKLIITYLK